MTSGDWKHIEEVFQDAFGAQSRRTLCLETKNHIVTS